MLTFIVEYPLLERKKNKTPRLACINFLKILQYKRAMERATKTATSRQHNSDFGTTTSTCQFTGEETLHDDTVTD